MAVNLLYPPIIDVAMPAFVVKFPDKKTVNVNFSLSKYNSPGEINSTCCVSLTDHATNESCFDTDSGLKFFNMNPNKNSIIISNEDVKGGWTKGKIYKLQIRFLKSETPSNKILNTLAGILSLQEEGYFSEWSTVCLLRPISEPTLILNNFLNNYDEGKGKFILNNLEKDIVGRVILGEGEELESYQIKIFDSNQKELYDTGLIYSDIQATNEINCKIIYGFVDGVNYKLKIEYTTSNGYVESKEYNFLLLNLGGEPLDAEIIATPNPQEGRIEVKIFSETERYLGNLTIRRASNRSNFTLWEDVKHIPITSARDNIDITWYDYTIESGIWYKYCVQKRDVQENRGLSVITPKPVMALLDDMFLSNGNRTLRIKFNPKVTSYNRVMSENSIQTIGSKYPFIRRNGNVNYRQFNISGLISHFMDEDELFTNRNELYNGHIKLYEEYNYENKIHDYNDFILERKFRQKVEDFLCDGQIKLFKSTPEGTLLVRLMNITLEPETGLGRMLYTFNATAYDIDEVNLKTLQQYEIFNPGPVTPIPSKKYEKTLPLKVQDFGAGISIHAILDNYENGIEENSKYETKINYIKEAKIHLESDPILIDLEQKKPAQVYNENCAMGYLVYVGREQINQGKTDLTAFYVPPRYVEDEQGNFKAYGYIHLSGEDLRIYDLRGSDSVDSPLDTSALIECTFEAEEFAVNETIPNMVYLNEGTGQVRSNYSSVDNIISFLQKKYFLKTDKVQKILMAINRIKIEADPYTVFYKQDSFSNDIERYVIGESGTLELKEEDFSIEKLYFKGTYVKESSLDENSIFNTVNEILNPINFKRYKLKNLPNGIYKPYNLEESPLNSYTIKIKELYEDKEFYELIYINNNWYLYDSSDNVAIHSIYALIDYDYEVEERQY